VNLTQFGCSYNTYPGDTIPCLAIKNGRSLAFHGCHWEPQGANYAVDIDSSGVDKTGILMSGCYFSGTASGTYVVNANFASCDLTMISCVSIQFANPYYLVRNQAAASIIMIGNSMDGAGASLIDSKGTNSIGIGNVVNTVRQPNWGLQTPVITDAAGAGATYDVNLAAAGGMDCLVKLTSNNTYTIRNFTNGVEGQRIFVVNEGTFTATIDRTNAFLSGGANQALGQFDGLALVKIGSTWRQISPVMVNS
jgi:hypothetical protein